MFLRDLDLVQVKRKLIRAKKRPRHEMVSGSEAIEVGVLFVFRREYANRYVAHVGQNRHVEIRYWL